MRCESCGAEAMLGSAYCWSCGRSLVGAGEQPATPAEPSYPAPPPPPPGWTLADGPAREALLPPPPTRPSLAANLAPPKDKKGCGCGLLVALGIAIVVAAIVGVVAVAADITTGDRVDAPALALGDTVRVELDANDTAVHPLAIGEGAITITVRSLDSDFDPVLEVVHTDGTQIGRNDDAIGRDSQLSLTFTEGGEVRVEVHEFTGDPGEYEVEVASGLGDAGPIVDPTDLVEGERVPSGQLHRSETREATIGARDTAVFTLPPIDEEGIASIFVEAVEDFDPVLQVLDGDGGVVGRNDDFEGLSSFLEFPVAPGDTFEVEVVEFSDEPGLFRIRLEIRDRPLR